jgi:hypothetical protein
MSPPTCVGLVFACPETFCIRISRANNFTGGPFRLFFLGRLLMFLLKMSWAPPPRAQLVFSNTLRRGPDARTFALRAFSLSGFLVFELVKSFLGHPPDLNGSNVAILVIHRRKASDGCQGTRENRSGCTHLLRPVLVRRANAIDCIVVQPPSHRAHQSVVCSCATHRNTTTRPHHEKTCATSRGDETSRSSIVSALPLMC